MELVAMFLSLYIMMKYEINIVIRFLVQVLNKNCQKVSNNLEILYVMKRLSR